MSQSVGDYRSRQTGNWNDRLTWEKYNGTAWISPSPDYPNGNDPLDIRTRITVQNGHTITATSNIRGRTSSAYLEIAAGGTLNMGSFYIYGFPAIQNRYPSIQINGTLNTSNYINSTTFTVGSTGLFNTSYTAGTQGWWQSSTSPTTVTLNGTVQYSGGSNQKVPAYSHNHLTIAGSSGTKTLMGNITVSGLLQINTNVGLNISGYTLTLNGPGILNNGIMETSIGNLNFGGSTQTFSGTGSFTGIFSNINIGTTSASNTTISIPSSIEATFITIDKTAPNLGSSLTLGPLSRIKVNNVLTNHISGGLVLKSDATGTASLIAASIGGTASASVELYLPGAAGGTLWHYITPPVPTASTALFSSVSIRNLTRYEEDFITTNMDNGWVNYEGWHYNTSIPGWEDLTSTRSWNVMTAGRGYNYYSSQNRTFIFTGTINTANSNINLRYNSAGGTAYPSQQGYNLIGNPFTSGINWDLVVAANSIWTNVEQTIYFRKNGLTYYYLNGITVPNDYGDARYISPMQGFFIKSNLDNVSLTIPASARIHTNQARFKSESIIPMIRLQVENGTLSDQAVIRLDNAATMNFDNSFDARKIYPATDYPYIAISSGDVDLAIAGIPLPDDTVEIPLSFIASSSGNFIIKASEISKLNNWLVILKDKDQNYAQNLSEAGSYSFTSGQGKFPGRFTITFIKNSVTGISSSEIITSDFRIFSGNGILNIVVPAENREYFTGDIKVFDLAGRTVIIVRKHEFTPGEIYQIPFMQSRGIYIVEISSQYRRFTGKVIVK